MFIVTKQIDSENIRKVCRTCLREDGEKMVCLFVGPAGSSLAAKLRTLSSLEVWQGDGLPEKLCDRCVTRAESALLYREQCRAADRALRQAASKVSREALDAGISNSKSYDHHKQDFHRLQNTQNQPKCSECGATFSTYRELCAHVHTEMPLFRENRPVQHMNIVESQNLGGYTTNETTHVKLTGVESNTFVAPGSSVTSLPTKNDRAACALHCSLCNHTFTNRSQYVDHDGAAHRRENVESSPRDSTINEKINELENLNFQRTIERSQRSTMENSTIRYDRTNVENVNYSSHPVLDTRNIVENSSMSGRRDVDNSDDTEISSDNCTDEILRFSTFDDVDAPHENSHSTQKLTSSEPLNSNDIYDNSSNNEKKIHRCDVCEKIFYQRSKLVAHNYRHTGEKPFGCENCEKRYSSKSKLNAHAKLHAQTNVHRCDVCEKCFSYPSYLVEHSKIHDNERNDPSSRIDRRYECSYCDKKFRLLKNLKIHVRRHTGKNLFGCEICRKTFPQKYSLKVHLRTHDETRKIFDCHYCGKNFAARGNFVEHLRIHTNVKPFKCDVCEKSFSQSSHLRTHEASHNSSRPHQCGLCGKRYKLAAHLRRHGIVHGPTKAYKCDLCEQIFVHEFSLKRHLKRHNEAQA